MDKSSLEVSDAAAAAVAVAPRVTLDEIKSAVESVHYMNGQGFVSWANAGGYSHHAIQAAAGLTICLVVLKNGFTVVGKSAPASLENFNAELGQKFAYEDALRLLWPLMGFALRDRLHRDKVDDEQFLRATQSGATPAELPKAHSGA